MEKSVKRVAKIFSIVVFLILTGCGGRHTPTVQPPPAEPPPVEPPSAQPFPSWDGIIAFRFGEVSGPSQLWLITPDETKLVTEKVYSYGSIRWSPDGNYLAYRDSGTQLIIASREGNLFHKFGSADEQISWSVDSKYVFSGVYFNGLYYYSVDGSSKRVLPSAYKTYDHNPVQSRDGKWVYFLHHEWEVNCTIYRIETDKLLKGATYSDCEKLVNIKTSSLIRDEGVQLEPREDGKIIIAYDDFFGLLDPENKTLQKISSESYSYIRLSPDGKYLATNESIIDAHTFQKVADIKLPDAQWPSSFAWHPDSQALAIAAEDYYPVHLARIYIWRFSDPRYQLIFEKSLPKGTSRYAYGEQTLSISWAK